MTSERIFTKTFIVESNSKFYVKLWGEFNLIQTNEHCVYWVDICEYEKGSHSGGVAKKFLDGEFTKAARYTYKQKERLAREYNKSIFRSIFVG